MKERLSRNDLVGSGAHVILDDEEAVRVGTIAVTSETR